ncbi:MAG: hypothetical protein NZ941_00010 [Candidatus Caldarchaeum sp.]|nr:hypothetical protein [Candidatus Caldarchaeum sp.]
MIYVMFGYYLGWQPSEVERMDYALVVKCSQVLQAMFEQFGPNLALTKGRGLMK